MINSQKPYKLIKHYKKNDLTRTYEQYTSSVESAYKSLLKIINTCESYTFERHKLIAEYKDQILTVELYDQQKPKLIPINELIFAQNDPKLRGS